MRFVLILALALAALVPQPGSAATIKYNVNLSLGPEFDRLNSFVVGERFLTGEIETDGTLGILSTANFVSWSLNIVMNSFSFNFNNLGASTLTIQNNVFLADQFGLNIVNTVFQADSGEFRSNGGRLSFSAPPTNSVGGPNRVSISGFVGSGSPFSNGSGLVLAQVPTNTQIATRVPLPAGLPLMAVALGTFGWLGWRRSRVGAGVAQSA